jgi:hypothetical protein
MENKIDLLKDIHLVEIVIERFLGVIEAEEELYI